MTLALVPVKRLADTQSRLLAHLAPQARESFALAMLEDVIAALLGAESIGRAIVLTPDESVAAAARAAGAESLVRDDPGLNPALDAGARELEAGDEPVLVVLGDVAGALPSDIDTLSSMLEGPGVALAPSSDGGTSALLRAPHDVIPSCFGSDSAKRHREAATRGGVAYLEAHLPSLALDLDLPEDVDRFLRTEAGGEHTRAALKKLGWGAPA
ncbi:MAG: 2-phospho-L-lactate guanylyltransferase [Myxococcota bacterium]|nr:2-phospho-L-lactate guanylyltransferase [Myxococcota bacterium]